MSTSVLMTTTRTLQKINARVFCQLQGGGGNPVTIFAPTPSDPSPIPSATQVALAKTCQWESLMLWQPQEASLFPSSPSSSASAAASASAEALLSSPLPWMRFFLPTGEEVSFCAHAAMGGAWQLFQQSQNQNQNQNQQRYKVEEPFTFTAPLKGLDSSSGSQMDSNSNSHCTAVVHDGDIVSLEFTNEPWQSVKVEHPSRLQRLLREACGIPSSALVIPPHEQLYQRKYPTFVNYGTARRPKTLVYMNSLQALHQARAPTGNPEAFARACDALGTTGLYLYCPETNDETNDGRVVERSHDTTATTNTFACRQFPRASAYPEDPATGIAASALAIALAVERDGAMSPQSPQFRQGSDERSSHRTFSYRFTQGTAMGRPSVILVENLKFEPPPPQQQQQPHDSSKNPNESNEIDSDKNNHVAEPSRQVSFRLLGQVQVDDISTVTVDTGATTLHSGRQ